MTRPHDDLRLAPKLAAQLRRRLRRDGAKTLAEIAGVCTDALHAAAAEVPIRRGSRLAIERLLAGADSPSAAQSACDTPTLDTKGGLDGIDG